MQAVRAATEAATGEERAKRTGGRQRRAWRLLRAEREAAATVAEEEAVMQSIISESERQARQLQMEAEEGRLLLLAIEASMREAGMDASEQDMLTAIYGELGLERQSSAAGAAGERHDGGAGVSARVQAAWHICERCATRR